jgi:large subunit ribosomal protein L21
MYAIVRIAGRQYRAEAGQTLDVDRLPQEIGEKVVLNEVMLIGDGDQTVIGQPFVDGAAVTATVEDQFRGEKILVFKYRQRTNYRRRQGHRQYHTRLRIQEISSK